MGDAVATKAGFTRLLLHWGRQLGDPYGTLPLGLSFESVHLDEREKGNCHCRCAIRTATYLHHQKLKRRTEIAALFPPQLCNKQL